MARKLAASHGLDDSDVIVDREQLEEIQGLLYCLQAAVEDVDRDIAEADGPGEIREALEWLLSNARPLVDHWIEPRTTESAEVSAGGKPV